MKAERTTTQLNAQTVILLHEIFAARLFRDFQVLFSHLPKKKIPNSPYFRVLPSLRSRRLEVAGERENGHARGRHARGALGSSGRKRERAHARETRKG